MLRSILGIMALLAGFTGPINAQTYGTDQDAPAAPLADFILYGGPIYTGEDTDPMVEAVVVGNGRFIFTGNLADARSFASDRTQEIDLQGAALYPGLVDAHAHLQGIGQREMTLNLEGTNTLDSFLAKIKGWRQDHPGDPIIVGRGWIETFWEEGRFPTRWDIDAVVGDIPVILTRADGHALVANSLALEISGITGQTEAPFGGDILINALDEPTGMLIDAAMALVQELRPRLTEERRRRALILGADVYAKYGWVGVHNMSVPMADVEALEGLAQAGEMPIFVYNSINQNEASRLFASGARETADGRIVTRAIKLYMDGALGSRGAALLTSYSDADTRGLITIQKEEATDIMAEALRRGIQINTHAIGDRANRLLLDWYEEVFQGLAPISRPIAEPRWRVEHAQILSPADLRRFVDMKVIPSMQPSHAISDLHFAPARLGDKRLDGAYAWRSLIDTGAIIAAGSDAPVERGDPMIEFYAAVARRDLQGFQGPDWRDNEKVTRMEALKMFTIWPAYAAFMAEERGSITPGKRADLTALSADIIMIDEAEIPKTKAVMTMVDGRIVYTTLADDSEGNVVPEENDSRQDNTTAIMGRF